MNDKELLELAARAAGIVGKYYNEGETTAYYAGSLHYMTGPGHKHSPWNPLTDDGDALRLAVKLRIGFDCYVDIDINEHCCAWLNHRDSLIGFNRTYETYGDDPLAATRRAIVRVAAEIGKAMP